MKPENLTIHAKIDNDPDIVSTVRNFTFAPILAAPHNIQFDQAKGNCLFFRVRNYPYKAIQNYLAQKEENEFSISGVYLRVCIHKQNTVLTVVVRYSTKTPADFNQRGGIRSRYTVTEKEEIFTTDAGKDQIVQIVDPYTWHLREVNEGKNAEIFLNSYNEWAHPLTLEEVAATLTEEQKLKAAKMLKVYLAA